MTTDQDFLKELGKKLWTAAAKLRSNLDAAVYKHAVLGLTFLKYRKRVPNDVRKEKHRGTEDTEYSAVASSVNSAPLCFKTSPTEIAKQTWLRAHSQSPRRSRRAVRRRRPLLRKDVGLDPRVSRSIPRAREFARNANARCQTLLRANESLAELCGLLLSRLVNERFGINSTGRLRVVYWDLHEW